MIHKRETPSSNTLVYSHTFALLQDIEHSYGYRDQYKKINKKTLLIIKIRRIKPALRQFNEIFSILDEFTDQSNTG